MNPIETFANIVQARRSVRIFDENSQLADEVIERAIDLAMLAPNSSNLQLWEFIRVKNIEVKKKLAYCCFNQRAARSAQEFLVVAVRRDRWRLHAAMNINWLKKTASKLQQAKHLQKGLDYYQKVVPILYSSDPLGILGFCKWVLININGLFRPIYRQVRESDLRIISHKSCALAAQTFMLAMKAQDYDTCPMEGFDSFRAKRLLDLPWSSEINMIIAVGKAAEGGGVYGPRYRIDRTETVRLI